MSICVHLRALLFQIHNIYCLEPARLMGVGTSPKKGKIGRLFLFRRKKKEKKKKPKGKKKKKKKKRGNWGFFLKFCFKNKGPKKKSPHRSPP